MLIIWYCNLTHEQTIQGRKSGKPVITKMFHIINLVLWLVCIAVEIECVACVPDLELPPAWFHRLAKGPGYSHPLPNPSVVHVPKPLFPTPSDHQTLSSFSTGFWSINGRNLTTVFQSLQTIPRQQVINNSLLCVWIGASNWNL